MIYYEFNIYFIRYIIISYSKLKLLLFVHFFQGIENQIKVLLLFLKIIKGFLILSIKCCEAQGKGRAKGRPRKVTQRSFIDGGWWMVDILSLMLYTKFGCHPPPPTTTGSLNKWLDEPVRGHVRLVKVKGGM